MMADDIGTRDARCGLYKVANRVHRIVIILGVLMIIGGIGLYFVSGIVDDTYTSAPVDAQESFEFMVFIGTALFWVSMGLIAIGSIMVIIQIIGWVRDARTWGAYCDKK